MAEMIQEIKNIHEDTGWYASYEESKQGRALILCQQSKIRQLQSIIETIKGEIELTENPPEYSHEVIIHSIKALLENIPEVNHTEGYFTWVG